MRRISSRTLNIILTVSLTVAVLTLGIIIACVQPPRSSVLKVYNWEDYISVGPDYRDLVKEFQAYYREVSGDKRFKVEYHTFSDNEELYSKIKTQKADYDIAFPSEYMVEKMRAEANGCLLKPIDTTKLVIGEEKLTYAAVMDHEILDRTELFSEADGQTWSIPYIVGTLGIMYDTKVIADLESTTGIDVATFEDLLHEYGWGTLFGKNEMAAYKGRVTMKKSARDTVGIAMLYAYENELRAAYETGDPAHFRTVINDVLNINEEAGYKLSQAQAVLTEQITKMKPFYENDSGKEFFKSKHNQYAFGLYWNCDAGLVMSDEDQDGNEVIRDNIKFYAPENGTNLWTDNFVLPVYGTSNEQTTAAAYAFISYLLDPKNAYSNSEYVGSIMAVKSAMENLHHDWDLTPEERAADPEFAAWNDNYLDTYFPTAAAIAHSAIMHNFATANNMEGRVNDLMVTVMNEAATGVNWLLIIWAIILVAGGITALVFWLTHRRRKSLPGNL